MSKPTNSRRRDEVSRPRKTAAAPRRFGKDDLGKLLPWCLLAATLLAYQPVWHAGFIWDDDFYVTGNSTLHDLNGLRRIWFEIGAVPQYYPLVHTVFWIENHIWGLHPLGYHLVNVLLHAGAAMLLARLLLRLQIPGAWLAAFVFALHPVGVESVAWVTELKNVLSAVFYLAAALAYWRFLTMGDEGRTGLWGWYAAAFVLFTAALFSKTITCSLPAALLLLRWWDRGTLRTADLWPLLPFFAIGLALGLQTAWMEKHTVGAQGERWALSFAESCLVAGRAVWFYVAKLAWPTHLSFIYPRWQIDSSVWWQWCFPLLTIGAGAALWLMRARLGRAPLTAFLFFIGTLGPALGFIDVYPMRYSFVADHFQYLASIGPITLAAAAGATWSRRYGEQGRQALTAAGAVILVVLAALTWRQATTYSDIETLWRRTIATNPAASIAHNNLGNILVARGRTDEARRHLQTAVDLQPGNPEARDSLGALLLEQGQHDAAVAHFRAALEVQPKHARTHYNLGVALLRKGETDAAIAALRNALQRKPSYHEAQISLGIALLNQGHLSEATAAFEAALKIQPANSVAHNNLGTALLQGGQTEAAIAHYDAAIRQRPDFVEAYNNLRYAAWLLATHPDPQRRNGIRALTVAQRVDQIAGHVNPLVLGTVAAAYAELGRFAEAVASAERAAELADTNNLPLLAADLRRQVDTYRRGQPLREEPARGPGELQRTAG